MNKSSYKGMCGIDVKGSSNQTKLTYVEETNGGQLVYMRGHRKVAVQCHAEIANVR